MDNLKRLKEEVSRLLEGDASASPLCWPGPVVVIQDVLLNEQPSDNKGRGPLKGKMSPKEYRSLLARWKKNLVGGEKTWGEDERVEWRPPKGTKVAYIGDDPYEDAHFYVLYLANGKSVFLRKANKGEYNLRNVKEKEDHQGFEYALKKRLSPES